MRIRLTLRRDPEPAKDLAVTVDGLATANDIATELFVADPARRSAAVPEGLTLEVEDALQHGAGSRVLDPDAALLESGLRPGATVALRQFNAAVARKEDRGPAAATLRIIAGPDAGKEFPLPVGTSYIGRGGNVDVPLSDPLASKRHARIVVSEHIEISDTNSANGLVMDGQTISKATLGPNDEVRLGDTVISVISLGRRTSEASTNPLVEFNRSPRVVPRFGPPAQVIPEGPEVPRPAHFPILYLIAPILMGGVMFAVTQNLYSIIFILMMPLMIIAGYIDQKIQARRLLRAQTEAFHRALEGFHQQMGVLQQRERAVRNSQSPSVSEVVDAIYKLGPLLWTTQPEHESFMGVRLGLGTQPSLIKLKDIENNRTVPDIQKLILQTYAQYQTIDAVPIVSQLRTSGGLGLAGSREHLDDVARAVVLGAVGLHSPAELIVTAIASAQSRQRWAWLQWLPHVGSVHSPLIGDHLASSPGTAAVLLSKLEDVVMMRGASMAAYSASLRGSLKRGDEKNPTDPPTLPSIMVIIEDDVNVDRSRLSRLAETGADVGVYVVWLASEVVNLPASCRDFLQVERENGATTGQVRFGEITFPVTCESVDAELAAQCARMLAPVVDVSKPVEDDSDLPQSVSWANLAGIEITEEASPIMDRWKENNSVAATAVKNRKHQGSLRALVGSRGVEPMYLDLKTEGPHALVGGTTGAGKSEFLQSWVLGMAAAYSPDRLTFLFVDYKGGAAFADCVQLPHTVGLVTDLSPHLVRRALTSLRAELHYREHLFNRKKAKDLLAMEREADPETPPSLVIVVDEFAALAKEVPEFVDGVVDVAARGRSLGLHLILATQRPAGVIKDNLRANTNMRIALRMADEEDSLDILGEKTAAYFSPSIPGRGAAKTGPGRVQAFQTGYAGGWTTRVPQRPKIEIVELDFGSGPVWEPELQSAPVEEDHGPNDIAKVVHNISDAAQALEIKNPRKPWLEELARTYDFSLLPNPRTDERLLLGVMDSPENQSQPTVFYEPERDGNLAIYGASGAGKSAALRTIAIAAAITPRGGPVQVYGVDAASNGLEMLTKLPHVGEILGVDDHERVGRLMRYLRSIIDDRQDQFAAVRADNIADYRLITNQPDVPRIFLLIDGLGTFRETYEFKAGMTQFETMQQIATDGRPLGVHVVVAADSTRAVPPSLAASIQQNLILRMASSDDYINLGAPKDVLSQSSPPGRGLLGGYEVQLAVFGGNANLALQSRQVEKLAAAMRRQGIPDAPGILALPENISFEVLPAGARGEVTLGIDDFNLAPVSTVASGAFLLAGPPASGRTTALISLARALKSSTPSMRRIYFGARKTAVSTLPFWDEAYSGVEEVREALEKVKSLIAAGDGTVAIFIESLTEFTESEVEYDLTALIKDALKNNHWVVGESETSTWSSAWNLAGPFKAGRRGLLLCPGDMDGEMLLSTNLGRLFGAKFTPGRGFLIGRGKAIKLQVANSVDG